MSSDPTRTHPRHQQEVNVKTSRNGRERDEKPTDERLKGEKDVEIDSDNNAVVSN
jgi:hypothetical protein